MTPPPGCTDDGPLFLSDLLRDMRGLKEQQAALDTQMRQMTVEQVHVRRQLEAIEAALDAIGVRESSLAVDAANREGRMTGQRNATLGVVAVVVPVLAGFLSWFIPATLDAIRYSQLDEERHRKQTAPVDPNPHAPITPWPAPPTDLWRTKP